MKASTAELLPRTPGPVTSEWPMGERFVPARVDHRFEEFTPDFAAWVVFLGPRGGE